MLTTRFTLSRSYNTVRFVRQCTTASPSAQEIAKELEEREKLDKEKRDARNAYVKFDPSSHPKHLQKSKERSNGSCCSLWLIHFCQGSQTILSSPQYFYLPNSPDCLVEEEPVQPLTIITPEKKASSWTAVMPKNEENTTESTQEFLQIEELKKEEAQTPVNKLDAWKSKLVQENEEKS